MSIKLFQLLTRSLFFACIFTIIYLVLLGGILLKRESSYSQKVYPHVYANGIDFGGSKKQEILEYYNLVNRKLGNVQIYVVYKDSVATFSGSMLQFHYDGDRIAEQIYAIGRSSHWATRLLQRYSTLLGINNYHFLYRPQYALAPIEEHFSTLADSYNIEPKDA